ncbi:hypothetical protein [Streptomyces sp. CB02261]|uniref:hypothetical protein n=1 Tax=Streptomyces sp. CB02261 TaxID=1703940 RepID=UPI00093E9042|nr:hypothetical protein [Streptomyces sp. CB02261]OKJ52699.1 hypothetical protein AMK29_31360 [Streptomyces sp. CB02261]
MTRLGRKAVRVRSGAWAAENAFQLFVSMLIQLIARSGKRPTRPVPPLGATGRVTVRASVADALARIELGLEVEVVALEVLHDQVLAVLYGRRFLSV